MGSLPRRIAAVTLATAALLGAAGTAATASATTIRYFKAYGVNPSTAATRAWSAAHAAGYTDDQCSAENEVISPGYWQVIVTCVS
ncbi:hypothetical protein [Kitasatospora purpeofusca]|uniref:hypothetical protein n=1 Tax=Kitasatospora purpeofusca TaxID=67352 RepID=UPI002A5AAD39|nr:hypothetical protein [Kitasatospora purpeofusca]MDY0813111.1 hypothetical protein [Kitasatospora purpeofusca]